MIVKSYFRTFSHLILSVVHNVLTMWYVWKAVIVLYKYSTTKGRVDFWSMLSFYSCLTEIFLFCLNLSTKVTQDLKKKKKKKLLGMCQNKGFRLWSQYYLISEFTLIQQNNTVTNKFAIISNTRDNLHLWYSATGLTGATLRMNLALCAYTDVTPCYCGSYLLCKVTLWSYIMTQINI